MLSISFSFSPSQVSSLCEKRILYFFMLHVGGGWSKWCKSICKYFHFVIQINLEIISWLIRKSLNLVRVYTHRTCDKGFTFTGFLFSAYVFLQHVHAHFPYQYFFTFNSTVGFSRKKSMRVINFWLLKNFYLAIFGEECLGVNILKWILFKVFRIRI